jgi:mRNA interferase RelE/StbE
VHRLELSFRAQRELGEIRGKESERIVAALRRLPGDPRPPGVRKLRGPIHRIRVGHWRIVYAVFDRDNLVIVGKIVRRSEKTYSDIDELF